MSQERVLNTLMSFGLTRMDAQVYIFLAKKGPQKAVDVRRAFKMSKPQLYRSLKDLEGRGIVSATLEHPAKFSALPFEKALDLLAKAKMQKALEEAQRIQEEKAAILANWKALAIGDRTDESAKFMVIEGRNTIYSKIQQMITETQDQLSTMTTVPSLIRADQFGLFDVGFQYPLKSEIKFRFLTELSEQNVPAMKTLLEGIAKANLNFEGRNPDLGLRLFPRMVIKDEDEILFFIRSAADTSATEQDNACIWTNCKDLVKAFTGIFEQLWQNSTDIQTKIQEIEANAAITGASAIKVDYAEALRSAKNEIVMMTSSKGLLNSWKNMKWLKEQAARNVSVKIMAPITSENLQAAQQLSEFCEVRHIPRSALGTTIVDGKHLFQFTNLEPENRDVTPHSKHDYCSDNQKYVERMIGMLADIWRNASAPSSVTLESILRPPLRIAASDPDVPSGETIKNDQAKLSAKSGWQATSITIGMAIIHPPKSLNLPDMLIHVQKSTKDAPFGASDTVIFYLCVGSPESDKSHPYPGGFSAYVPLAIINNNPRSSMMFKALYAGSPAAQNIITTKPNQLEGWKQDNTLFAGWTVPIPLLPPKYSLPPSCILFEGIGEAKHVRGSLSWRSGYKSTGEGDQFEAFVTFINPSSNYSGPGTDGFLRTNIAAVTTPLN